MPASELPGVERERQDDQCLADQERWVPDAARRKAAREHRTIDRREMAELERRRGELMGWTATGTSRGGKDEKAS